MSITISLSPEDEKRLRDRAARAGQDVAAYLCQLIRRDVHDVDEALAPFRDEVAKSGISDEDLRDFFHEVRDEVWQEKQGKPNGPS